MINKDYGANSRPADVTVTFPQSFSADSIRECSLSVPDGDMSRQTGMTLGGAGISPDGNWSGTWTTKPKSATPNVLNLNVPAASAAIFKITFRPAK